MTRTTRRGTQFSPYHLDPVPPPKNIDIFRSSISLAPLMRDALAAADLRAAEQDKRVVDEVDGWEDEDEGSVLSRPPTPLSRSPSPLSMAHASPTSSRASSPLSDAPPSPIASPSSSLYPPTLDLTPSLDAKQRRAIRKAARRKRQRVENAQSMPFGRPPRKKHSFANREELPHKTSFIAGSIECSSGGGWRTAGATKKPRLSRKSLRRLEELLADGDELVEWDGRCVAVYFPPCLLTSHYSHPKLILDAEGRIVAVLLGRPEGDDWDAVVSEMGSLFEGLRARGLERGVFKSKNRRHRRGNFYTLVHAMTKGPGQKVRIRHAQIPF